MDMPISGAQIINTRILTNNKSVRLLRLSTISGSRSNSDLGRGIMMAVGINGKLMASGGVDGLLRRHGGVGKDGVVDVVLLQWFVRSFVCSFGNDKNKR